MSSSAPDPADPADPAEVPVTVEAEAGGAAISEPGPEEEPRVALLSLRLILKALPLRRLLLLLPLLLPFLTPLELPLWWGGTDST